MFSTISQLQINTLIKVFTIVISNLVTVILEVITLTPPLSSSKQQQGIIFFSDPQEARRALIQMDGYVIPAKANNQRSRTSYFLSNSNPGVRAFCFVQYF